MIRFLSIVKTLINKGLFLVGTPGVILIGTPTLLAGSISLAGNFSIEECRQPHQLPMITNFQRGVGYIRGGTDDPQEFIFNLNASNEVKAGVKWVPSYMNQFLPEVDHYLADTYDSSTYDDDFVIQTLDSICNKTGIPHRLRQVPIEIQKKAQLKALFEREKGYGQIIHHLVFKKNVFTIILPPNWNSGSGTKRYSLLLNGFYGINSNLITLEGPSFLEVLGRVYQETGHGAVALLWNGGGGVASRTMNDQAYRDLNEFLKMFISAAHVDPSRVITAGGSRGGLTAFNIASHDSIKGIGVRFVYAATPPNDVEFVGSLVGSTVPLLLYASDWSTGWFGSWSKNFIYPEGFNDLAGLTGVKAHVKVLTGTNDSVLLAEHFSLTAPKKLKKLLKKKTELFLEIGSHDVIVPWIDKFKLMQKLLQSGIRVEFRLNYLSGHTPERKFRTTVLTKVLMQLENEILNGRPRRPLIKKGRITSYLQKGSGVPSTRYSNFDKQIPFTLEVPRFIHSEFANHFVATGRPGARYKLSIRHRISSQLKSISVVLDESGIWIQELNPNEYSPGDYVISSIEEVSPEGFIVKQLKTLKSNLPQEGPLEMTRIEADPRTWGGRPEVAILSAISGSNNELSLRSDLVPLGVNYGVVEILE